MPTPLCIRRFDTPLGPVIAGATERGVALLAFEDEGGPAQDLSKLAEDFGEALEQGAFPVHDQLQAELAAYFAGALREFTVPIATAGTDFQQSVWSQLRGIPYGQTRAYGVLAKALTGDTKASRAVAAANGQNRLAILVPCHRVVGADGGLTGYAWGLWRKRALLALERGQGDLFG